MSKSKLNLEYLSDQGTDSSGQTIQNQSLEKQIHHLPKSQFGRSSSTSKHKTAISPLYIKQGRSSVHSIATNDDEAEFESPIKILFRKTRRLFRRTTSIVRRTKSLVRKKLKSPASQPAKTASASKTLKTDTHTTPSVQIAASRMMNGSFSSTSSAFQNILNIFGQRAITDTFRKVFAESPPFTISKSFSFDDSHPEGSHTTEMLNIHRSRNASFASQDASSLDRDLHPIVKRAFHFEKVDKKFQELAEIQGVTHQRHLRSFDIKRNPDQQVAIVENVKRMNGQRASTIFLEQDLSVLSLTET